MDSKTEKYSVDGWNISLQRNVHMYCHSLSVENSQYRFNIECEDLPTHEKTIGIWLHNSKIPVAMITELKDILLRWSESLEIEVEIRTN
ncbi:hypothetical protein QWY82_18865 [Simiduia curdlanivorans]|uniref:Uncharacterized protein n=1 Tax=Simiduia curdlanivorans TaxID=1492769 RepID=A0ABV8V5X0_9GAMM|nr:hypothetical protein [Simiduia curdlanivorans]MDN3640869.1 hypothetical protein [Simiduia curdlanivorans]